MCMTGTGIAKRTGETSKEENTFCDLMKNLVLGQVEIRFGSGIGFMMLQTHDLVGKRINCHHAQCTEKLFNPDRSWLR